MLELVNGRPLELAVAVAQRVRDGTDLTFAREESGELAGDLSTRHYAGSLSIEGPGTRRWTLDANNGDATTFQLDVTEDGTTTSYTVPWSTRFNFDRFETADIDLGF